jgi:glutaredoxin/glutathione-dependent peroxiredoxin
MVTGRATAGSLYLAVMETQRARMNDMTISVGGTLPEATFVKLGAEGPESVSLGSLLAGRKIVLFALPGAYTGPCSTSHIPSFIRTADAFRAKGVAEIICVSVNDPFVLKAWGEATGAAAPCWRACKPSDFKPS